MLLSGQTTANIGDILYTISVINSVYSWTHNAFMTSLVPVLLTASMMISGFLTPLITSHWRLNRILFATQLGKFFLLLGLIAVFGLNPGINQLVCLYTTIIAIALLDGFAEPVSAALVPHYVPDSYLVKANSLLGGAYQLLGIGGWALGSILLGLFKIDQLLILSVLFAMGASVMMGMLPNIHQGIQESSHWKQFTSGLQIIRKSRLLATVTLMDLLETATDTVWVSAIILVFVRQLLHASAVWWGYINAAYMLGALLGSWGCYLLARTLDAHIVRSIILGSSLASGVMLLVAFNVFPVVTLGLSLLFGICTAVKNVPETTLV